jgi:hypothetical protein
MSFKIMVDFSPGMIMQARKYAGSGLPCDKGRDMA